jgi:hypothetical protein
VQRLGPVVGAERLDRVLVLGNQGRQAGRDRLLDAAIPFAGSSRHPEAQYLPADLTQEVLHAIDEPRSYAGRERVILVGPRGQAIINEFIAAGMVVDPSAPLFSPRRAREERFEAMRAIRQTRVQPSQPNRRKAKPKLQPAEGYTAHTYAHAVRVAAEKAFPCRSRCPASRVNRGAHGGGGRRRSTHLR